MSNKWHFWRNVALIVIAHVIAVVGLVRWNASSDRAKSQTIVWVAGDDSVPAGGSTTAHGSPPPLKSTTPVPAEATPPAEAPDEDPRLLASANSEIELPAPTATPTPTVRPTVEPVIKTPPKPSPRPPKKPRPKPTPTATPKPTPKPKPRKTLLAKILPRPTPHARPSPPDTDEESDRDESANEARKTESAEKNEGADNEATTDKTAASGTGSSSGSGGVGGHGKGMSKNSEFAAYGKMLHDRFYGEWIQPTTTVASTAKISTLVHVRIEKDGRVSSFEVIKPSGNVMVDDSVAAIGKHVTQVDAPPAALRHGSHYDVKINFELNSD